MDLYYSIGSPPCRSVIMVTKALGLEPNKIIVNTMEKEQLKPEFLKINPQHTIPTLVDNGFALWESRAILQYLVEKYGKEDDPLYPKCPQKRALINQRLYFDMGTLTPTMGEYYIPIFKFKREPDPEKFKKIENAFELLNTFLEGQTYVAGNELTIADLSLLAIVSTFEIAKFEINKYANVAKWYEHLKQVAPGWKENWEGCLAVQAFMKKH